MKYINKFILFTLVAFLIMPSCDDPLKEEPFSDVAVGSFYKTPTEFELALNAVYADLWSAYVYKDNNFSELGDQTTDIITTPNGIPSWEDTWDWDRTTRNLADWWRDTYPAINNANKIIKELGNVELDQAFEDRIEGETKFLRALYYYNMVKMFKGVPMMTEPVESVSEEVYKERGTMEEGWQLIESDLTTAENKLDMSGHSIGRVTTASASALLARVHAWQKEWEDAAAAADRALSHSEIFLEPDYQKIWHPDFENGGEHLFSIAHGEGNSTSNIGNHRVWWMNVNGFVTEDGKAIRFANNEGDKGHTMGVPYDYYNSVPDTYRKMYTMRDYMPFYIDVESGEVVEERIEWPSGKLPMLVKLFHLDGNYNVRTEVNDEVLRTSEMYLIKAEALNEINGPTQEALDALNMVRRRARAVGTPMEQDESVYPDITMADASSKEDLREIIIEEFAREFIGEGLFRGVLLRHDQYTTRSWEKGEVPPQNQQEFRKFWPIPDIEMERNENLVQNEGYLQ